VNGEIVAAEVEPIDRSDLAFETFGSEIFNQLLYHLILDCGVVDGIGSEAFQETTHLGSDDLGSVGDLQDNHEVGRCLITDKLVRMGRLELPRCCHH
tara:strand:- start:435 stop:725 length:291 start_codon:yes stop_codon:yes gene_type:complete